MKKTKDAVVLIYVLFLVIVSVIFASILLSNNSNLFNTTSMFESESKLYSNIDSDSIISINLVRKLNSNGGGFIDNISCPSGSNITMSGTLNTGNIGTVLINSGSIHCEGIYNSKELKIYFNSGFTDLIEAEYDGHIVGLTSGLGNTNFSDSDDTLIDFSSYNYLVGDGIDDNFDSDNYSVTSTGDILTGDYYPNNYQDDDNLARKKIIGYVPIDYGFKKIFWSTTKGKKIINNNQNNNDSLNKKLGDVTSGYLNIDVDRNSKIKLVKFDKNIYDESRELIVREKLNGDLLPSIGYLQNVGGILSLSNTITGNEYDFDFVNNDYALFLKATGTETVLYSITGETSTGTGIYINPIDDSGDNIIKYLGNEIIIDSDGLFISKETELIYKK